MKKQTIRLMTISFIVILMNNSFANASSNFVFNLKSDFLKEYELKVKELEEVKRLELQLMKEQESERVRIQNVSFDENDLTKISNIKEEELYEILPNSMKHLAYAITSSEKKYKVSAFVLTSIIALESAWATSSRAINSNNLTGMAVYGDESEGIYYNSQDECVYDTARQLEQNYLNSDGIFYNGVSTKDVNILYCTSNDWYLKINEIAYDLLEKYDKIYRGNL